MSAIAKLKAVPVSDAIEFYGADYPLVPEGVYNATYTRHETVKLKQFGDRIKLFVHFRLVDPGPAFEAVLFRAYNVKSGRQGFRAPKRGSLAEELRLALPAGYRVMFARPSVKEAFAGRIVKVQVETVIENGRQGKTPEEFRYSVIRKVLGAETEDAADAPLKNRAVLL